MVQRTPGASTRMPTTDEVVGARIRKTRLSLGVKQTALAQQIGVSYQQLQKYEEGQNRLSVGKLWTIAAALGVPVSDLVADVDITGRHDTEYVQTSREALDLFNRLPAHRRRAILTLMRQDEGLDEAE
jgi:transcriptional regulator with XRE-family HTH domain